MAKQKNLGFITAGVTALALGAVDQAVLQAAPHKAARNQALLTGALAIGGGIWRLLSPEDNVATHLADGTFTAGVTLLGQSGMHYTQTSLLANRPTPQGQSQGGSQGSSGSAAGSSGSSGSAASSGSSSGSSAPSGSSSAASGSAGDTGSDQTSADY